MLLMMMKPRVAYSMEGELSHPHHIVDLGENSK